MRSNPFRSLLALVLGGMALSTAIATAQLLSPGGGTGTPGSQRQVLDGVAAVVGNEVVLLSDVYQQAALYARQNPSRGGVQVDPADPKIQREILNAIIDEKLVLARAREDSLTVSDDELARAVDRQVGTIVERMGGDTARVEKAYGMSMSKIRQESREIIRQQFLTERERQRRFADLKVNDNDVQEFYRLYRDSLPQVPDQVELQSIVLLVKPSAEAKAATMSLARSIIDSIKAGADFADFARRYSADPGSASSGGDVGYVEKGRFVKEYEDATRKLKVNEISEPVESQYGIHIIQLLDRRGDATHSRHILLTLHQSDAERDSMVAKLKSIKDRAMAGESFADLARKYSDDDDSKANGGSLGKIAVEQVPADMKSTIVGMKEGDITDPEPVQISPTENGYQIVRLARRVPAHTLDPVADRIQLERLALLYKQNTEYSKWITELRSDIFWEVKTNF
ncbi:MAG: surA [Chlorobi bacterium]|nr:surA [Chlorobiota bacterium]